MSAAPLFLPIAALCWFTVGPLRSVLVRLEDVARKDGVR